MIKQFQQSLKDASHKKDFIITDGIKLEIKNWKITLKITKYLETKQHTSKYPGHQRINQKEN